MTVHHYKNLNHTANNPNGILPKITISFKINFKKMQSVITILSNQKKDSILSMNFYTDLKSDVVWIEHSIKLPINNSTLLDNILPISLEQFLKFTHNQISYNDIIQEQKSFIVKVKKRNKEPIYHQLNPEYYHFKYGQHILLDYHEYNPSLEPQYIKDFQPFISKIEHYILSKTPISTIKKNTIKI